GCSRYPPPVAPRAGAAGLPGTGVGSGAMEELLLYVVLASLVLAGSALLIAAGIAGIFRFARCRRFHRLDANYRAAALVCNAEREVRAAQHREWGRAA